MVCVSKGIECIVSEGVDTEGVVREDLEIRSLFV